MDIRQQLTAGGAVLTIAALVWLVGHLRNRTNRTRNQRGRGFVWACTLSASTILGVVIVLTQVGFYRQNLGDATPVAWLPWLNLAFLTPIAVEAVAWVFTVMTSFAVINNKPSGSYERSMWLFSAIAAAVNAWHNIHRGDWVTGIVLGGMSIVGPLMVHKTLQWDRNIQSDKTAQEIREAAIARAVNIARRGAQVVRHPRTSWRTVSIATDLGCSWDSAYRVALLGQRDAVHEVLRTQFERALPSVHTREVESAPVEQEGPHEPVHDSEAAVHEDDAQGRARPMHEGVHGDLFPMCTDPLIKDLHELHDPGALFSAWGFDEGVHNDDAHDLTCDADDAQGQVHDPVHDGAPESAPAVHDPDVHDAPDAVHEPVHDEAETRAQGSAPKRAPRDAQPPEDGARKVVHAQSERQEHVAARHWWECTNAGTDPRAGRTNREIADELGINKTAVSRGFKLAQSGEFPNPQKEG